MRPCDASMSSAMQGGMGPFVHVRRNRGRGTLARGSKARLQRRSRDRNRFNRSRTPEYQTNSVKTLGKKSDGCAQHTQRRAPVPTPIDSPTSVDETEDNLHR